MTEETKQNPEEVDAQTPELSRLEKSAERAQRREKAACDALRTLIRDHFTAHFGALPPNDDQLALSLNLQISPTEDWAIHFDPPFQEQIHSQFEDSEAGRDLYLPGHAFCYRCRTSECEHSVPPVPSFVFQEYTPNGRPQWGEFVQTLIDSGDERVDQLYNDPPAVLARVQLGSALKSRQLSSYGKASKTYTILGQVVAGHFKKPATPGKMDAQNRMAITLQIVETRNREGLFELKLNPICAGVAPGRWEELIAGRWKASVGKGFALGRRHVRDVERKTLVAKETGDSAEISKQLRAVPTILRNLAHSLERGIRQDRRRTRHARQRSSKRPVHKAMEDARSAGEELLFFDEKEDTWIACGKRGRAHAFNKAGRHVTSFVLPPGGAESRVKKNRWRVLQPEEVVTFKGLIHQDQDPDASS